jgi:hypothetical protein
LPRPLRFALAAVRGVHNQWRSSFCGLRSAFCVRRSPFAASDRFALAVVRREKPTAAGRPNRGMRGRGFLTPAATRLLIPSLLHSSPVSDAHPTICLHF